MTNILKVDIKEVDANTVKAFKDIRCGALESDSEPVLVAVADALASNSELRIALSVGTEAVVRKTGSAAVACNASSGGFDCFSTSTK